MVWLSGWQNGVVNGLPARDKIPGYLSSKKIDGQHHILVADQGEEFGHYLTNVGATAVSQSGVNLERAVNAFLTKNHNSPDSRV